MSASAPSQTRLRPMLKQIAPEQQASLRRSSSPKPWRILDEKIIDARADQAKTSTIVFTNQ
jgi:hypothetical protein